MFCVPNAGLILVPAIAADALTSALTIVPSAMSPETIVPSAIIVDVTVPVSPVVTTVPDTFGKLIFRSAVGSTTPNLVSLSSVVVPSNMIPNPCPRGKSPCIGVSPSELIALLSTS